MKNANVMNFKIKDIKAACTTEYRTALIKAKNAHGMGVYRSRGNFVCIYDQSNTIIAGEAESWAWTGTKAGLSEIQAYLDQHPEAKHVYISGGIDYSDSVLDFYGSGYIGLVEEWIIRLTE